MLTSYVLFFSSFYLFNLDWGGDGAKSSKSTTSITTAATPFTTGITTIPPPSSKSGKVSLSTKSSKSGSTDLPTAGTAAMSLPLVQEPAMAEGNGDGGGLTQRDDTIVTPTISPTRCNDNMVWHYDSHQRLCTNEVVNNIDTAEDTDMIYESLGDCCDVHFNIRVSNDLGLDFDSNGIDSGCDSFDVCEVSFGCGINRSIAVYTCHPLIIIIIISLFILFTLIK